MIQQLREMICSRVALLPILLGIVACGRNPEPVTITLNSDNFQSALVELDEQMKQLIEPLNHCETADQCAYLKCEGLMPSYAYNKAESITRAAEAYENALGYLKENFSEATQWQNSCEGVSTEIPGQIALSCFDQRCAISVSQNV